MAEQFGVTRERQALDLDTPEERGQEAHGFISKADVGYRPSPEELAKLQGE